MKKILLSSLVLGSALVAGISTSASAALITGDSLSISQNSANTPTVSPNNGNLSSATSMALNSVEVNGASPNFGLTTPVIGTTSSTISFIPNAGTANTATGFSFTAGPWTFTTAGDTTVLGSGPDSIALNSYLGTITGPDGTYPAKANIGFTQAGGAGSLISYSGTVSVVSATVPEPLTTAGAGLALGLGFLAKRKISSVKK